jgi:hypothetical protein
MEGDRKVMRLIGLHRTEGDHFCTRLFRHRGELTPQLRGDIRVNRIVAARRWGCVAFQPIRRMWMTQYDRADFDPDEKEASAVATTGSKIYWTSCCLPQCQQAFSEVKSRGQARDRQRNEEPHAERQNVVVEIEFGMVAIDPALAEQPVCAGRRNRNSESSSEPLSGGNAQDHERGMRMDADLQYQVEQTSDGPTMLCPGCNQFDI